MIVRTAFALLAINTLLAAAQSIAGDACTIRATSGPGTCVSVRNCPVVVQAIREGRRDHTVCSFQGFMQIVCCPAKPTKSTTVAPWTPSSSDRVSVRKCNEYKEAVYETLQILTIFDGKPIEKKVERCAADSVALIIGGTEARPYEFPHMALIGYNAGPGELKWHCGGTLISENFVLTAGHCMHSQEFGEPQKIRLGAHDINKIDTDEDHTADYNIAERIRNPEYRASSQYNDIALIRMASNVRLTPYVRPACLPTAAAVPTARAIATGWGQVEWKGSASNVLLKVVLDMFTHSECNETFKYNINRRLKNGIVDQTQVCAGSYTEEKDTCQGDSGGPLQIYHPSHYCMYTVVGITSFGKICGLVASPGVYTRVFAYLEWIERTVWPNE